MYINSLSPVLEEMLVCDNSNDITHLEISDATLLKEYFAEKAIQSLLNKQYMLVVTPDHMETSIPAKILTQYNLAHFTSVYAPGEDDIDISERMRTLSALNIIPLLRQEYNHTLLKFKELNNKIHDTLLSINKRNVKSPSFKEMLLSIKPRPKGDLPESIKEAISSININPDIIEEIRQLQSIYERRFIYMDECGGITKECLEDKDSLAFAQEEISDVLLEINDTILNVERELYLMKRVIAYEVEDELSHWSKIKEELQNVFLVNELDNYHTSFEEHGIPIIRKLNGYKYLKININVTPEMGWGQVSNILAVITAVMESAGNSIDIYFEEYVQKLSPFNTANELLDHYLSRGARILQAVNNSKYIHYQCSHQFLQVDAMIHVLKEARRKILLCKRTLEDEDYIKFKISLRDLNVEEVLLRSLYHLENEDWGEIIEFYGQRSHLIHSYNSNMNRLEDWYKELNETHQLLKHTSHKEVHNRWCGIRNEAMSKIRNRSWENYNSIFENSESNLSIQKAIRENGSDIQSFFPIMIVKNSEVQKLFAQTSLEFENVFFLDPKEVSTRDINLLKNHKFSITIASTFALSNKEVLNKYDVVSNYCSDSRVKQNVILIEQEKSHRYKYAVALSSSLSNQIRSANIYKLGEKILISTLDPLLDVRLCSELKISTNNILYQSTNEISDFVEILIHYNDISLLIENNLLNDHYGLSTLWQRDVLDQLNNAGLSIVNINTHDIYQNLNGAISKLASEFKIIQEELSQEASAVPV